MAARKKVVTPVAVGAAGTGTVGTAAAGTVGAQTTMGAVVPSPMAKAPKAHKAKPHTAMTLPAPIGPSDITGIVKPPPKVKVPAPPAGFIPPSAADYRGFRPKRAELAVVPDAVLELQGFSNYAAVFGMTAPPVDHVASALDGASKWSTLLSASTEWMSFVKAGEGMAWKDTLTLTDRLKAPFGLASANDPSMLAKYPALARMLGAAKAIAKKAVATKKRTAKAKSTAVAGTAQPAQPAPAAQPAATQAAVATPGVTVAVTQ